MPLDRRHLLTGALGAAAAAAPLPSPADAAPVRPDLASASRPELLAALVRTLEADAAELAGGLAGDPFVADQAARAGCTSPRAFLVALQVGQALDIIDELLSLPYAERLEVWRVIEQQAAGRRDFAARAAAHGRKIA